MIDDRNRKTPLYRQIYQTIRQAILTGEFQPTMPLPATRLLAKQLGVSRMTIVNAYDQLFAEGYLEAKTGAGTFVAARLPEELLQTPRGESRKNQKEPPTHKIKFSDYGKQLAKNPRTVLQNHGASLFCRFSTAFRRLINFLSMSGGGLRRSGTKIRLCGFSVTASRQAFNRCAKLSQFILRQLAACAARRNKSSS